MTNFEKSKIPKIITSNLNIQTTEPVTRFYAMACFIYVYGSVSHRQPWLEINSAGVWRFSIILS